VETIAHLADTWTVSEQIQSQSWDFTCVMYDRHCFTSVMQWSHIPDTHEMWRWFTERKTQCWDRQHACMQGNSSRTHRTEQLIYKAAIWKRS
jgi:hypothetical protein